MHYFHRRVLSIHKYFNELFELFSLGFLVFLFARVTCASRVRFMYWNARRRSAAVNVVTTK